jgi:hypothetical protein
MTSEPSAIIVEPRPPLRWVRRHWPVMDAPHLPRDRLSTCYHEIGHAVVGWAYGNPVCGVVVRRDNSGSSYHTYGYASKDFNPNLEKSDGPLPLDGMWQLMPSKIAIYDRLLSCKRGIDAELRPFNATIMQDAALAVASDYFAGTMAEMLLHGHQLSGPFALPGCSDFDLAYMALNLTFGGNIGVFYAMATARAILTEHWPVVQRLATALDELHFLHGDEIQPLLDEKS